MAVRLTEGDVIDLRLLGDLRIRIDDADVALGGSSSRRLLALLALHRNDGVASDRIADVLWRDEPPADPANAVQVAVSRLRRRLGPAGPDLVRTVRGGYRLVVGRSEVDVDRFDDRVTAGRRLLAEGAEAEAVHDLDAALATWGGAPFGELPDDDRALAEASRLVERRRGAVADRARVRLAGGHHAEVVAELSAEVADVPLDEDLHASLMTALARSGRATDALEVFAGLRGRLVDDLGVEPGPALQDLQRAVLDQDPAVVASTAPPRPSVDVTPSSQRRQDLPSMQGAFVGRARALDEVLELLTDRRVVTLVGPGGTGKTRLALEVVRRLRAGVDAGDGRDLCVAELAPITEPRAVLPTLAAALGVSPGAATRTAEMDPTPIAERVRRQLAGRSVVVVLDNCEHLLDAVAETVELVIGADRSIRVLATSREPLRVAGEQVWSVPPLDVPPGDVTDARELASHSAVALLVDRAAERAPSFRLDDATAAHAARLCRRLDGLPLALELAASRLSSMAVADLADRLDDRFALLTGGPRTASTRQRTLKGVLDWSHDLLDDRQRAVLRRVSVFAGNFDLHQAEAVCADPEVLGHADVTTALGDLVDKSLVVFDDTSGRGHHRLLDTVRAYARRLLDEAGEGPATRDRHLALYLDVARRGRIGLRGADQLLWLDRIERAHDDLRAAGAWALRANPHRARELGAAVAWFWWLRDHHQEAVHFLDEALGAGPGTTEADSGVPDTELTAEVAAWRAFLLAFLPGGLDRLDGAMATLEAAERAVEATRPSKRTTTTAVLHGFVALVSGRPAPDVLERFERAERDAVEIGDDWALAAAAFCRAQALVAAGRPSEGQDAANRSIEVARSIGDRWAELQSRQWLAMWAAATGDHATATSQLEVAVSLAEPLMGRSMREQLEVQVALARGLDGAPDQARRDLQQLLDESRTGRPEATTAWAEHALGLVVRLAGEHEAAARWHRQAADRFGRVGEDVGRAEALAGVAFATAQGGLPTTAREAASEALGSLTSRAGLPTRALLVEAAAAVLAAEGDGRRSAAMLGAAEAIRDTAGLPLVGVERGDVDAVLDTARAHAGGSPVARALSSGRDADLAELLEAAGLPVPSTLARRA